MDVGDNSRALYPHRPGAAGKQPTYTLNNALLLFEKLLSLLIRRHTVWHFCTGILVLLPCLVQSMPKFYYSCCKFTIGCIRHSSFSSAIFLQGIQHKKSVAGALALALLIWQKLGFPLHQSKFGCCPGGLSAALP